MCRGCCCRRAAAKVNGGWRLDEGALFASAAAARRSNGELLLLLAGLFGGLGDLASAGILFGDGLDDADGDRLPHVTDGEATQGRVLGESLHRHGLGRCHFDDGGVTILDGFGESLQFFAGTTITFFEDLFELAGNVSCVAIHDRRVPVLDFSGVVQDDHLGVKVLALFGRIVLGVRGDIATADFLDGNVLDVEADVVTRKGLRERLVVHLHGFDLSSNVGGRKSDDHTRFDDSGLDTSNGHRSNASDFVDILERETKRLVCRALRRDNGVEGINEGEPCGDIALNILAPTLFFLSITVSSTPPGHLLGLLQHVVPMPPRDGAEDDFLGVVPDFLDVALNFLTDFQESWLAVRSRGGAVHLIDSNDKLLDTKGESEESVLTGLAILGDSSLEFTVAGGDDENGAVGLRGAGDHVFDEISVARGIDDGDVVVFGLELPQCDVNGDTTLSLSLELVQDPSVFEGALAHLLGLLLELFNDTLVDSTAFVDKMASGRGLARVDVSDDDDVDVELLFSHIGFLIELSQVKEE